MNATTRETRVFPDAHHLPYFGRYQLEIRPRYGLLLRQSRKKRPRSDGDPKQSDSEGDASET